MIREGPRLSAEIVWLVDRRAEVELTIDLRTAVDAAIRDLLEIESKWGTEPARERLLECREMLQGVFAAS
jgi:hypothetical protein